MFPDTPNVPNPVPGSTTPHAINMVQFPDKIRCELNEMFPQRVYDPETPLLPIDELIHQIHSHGYRLTAQPRDEVTYRDAIKMELCAHMKAYTDQHMALYLQLISYIMHQDPDRSLSSLLHQDE